MQNWLKKIWVVILGLQVLTLPLLAETRLRPSLAKLTTRDSLCPVWVVFTDKNKSSEKGRPSLRSQNRRARAGVFTKLDLDYPIFNNYIDSVVKLGGQIRQQFKWANAVSFNIPSRQLQTISKCSFIKDVLSVRSFANLRPHANLDVLKKRSANTDSSSFYGNSFRQLSMVGVPGVQSYLNKEKSVNPGNGILIGLFDSGFRFTHHCLDRFMANHKLLAQHDFIDDDATVSDPDSVANNPGSDYYQNDDHGSKTLSLIAGYDSLHFVGVAWDAEFILARTENSKLISTGEIEQHQEEDNWAAAMVWAESLGVDIVSSSLGYRDGFTPPDTDYTYQDMNGATTIISKAATVAAQLGVVIVNAMGNDGPTPGSLCAPADVADVVSVGAVDALDSITFFSSRGPTADGRIKPDCVAMGQDVVVPLVYGGTDMGSYTLGNGTSFSTPLVAGVCALIAQVHSGYSAPRIRASLYAACYGQIAQNNMYGRGIPDARLACLPLIFRVNLTDSLQKPVRGTVYYKSNQDPGYSTIATDSLGLAIITGLSSAVVDVYAEAPGYLRTPDRKVLLSDTSTTSVAVILTPRLPSQFVLFPNVLHRQNRDAQLTVEFTSMPDDPRNYSQLLTAAIRSIDGKIVWSTAQYLAENQPVVLQWPQKGARIAFGVYYFIVNYAGKTYKQKFFVVL